MKNCLFIVVLILFFSTTSVCQVDNFAPRPSWVKPIEIPVNDSISQYDISSGYYHTLIDYQLDFISDANYFHEVRKVLSYNGISNASQLSVDFDTTFQTLEINHLYVWRSGEKIDRTDALSFEILNNEYNLDQGIYSGTITAYDILDDIRKDDMIDFAYTLRGSNPIFDHEKYLDFAITTDNYIDKFHIITRYNKGREFLYKCDDCDSFHGFVEVYDTISEPNTLTIEVTNLNPITVEDYVPSWISQYPNYFLSSMSSWRDVNTWAQKIFETDDTELLSKVYDEVFSGNESLEDKINLLIDFVQDDIRYMGIESGIWGIQPTQPDKVIEQRYGDCKDKSLLLISFLKDIGISDAYPVLLNTMVRHELNNHFPTNQLFNHCIVCFDYNDSRYWVDPTATLQGGDFKNLYIENYGKVLVVGEPADSLTTMTPTKVVSETHITEEFHISSFTKPTQYTIVSSNKGAEADLRRSYLEYYSLKDFSEMMNEDVKRLFPQSKQIAEIVVDDDPNENELSLTYQFEIEDMWEDNKRENVTDLEYRLFQYEPLSLYQFISETTFEERTQDFWLNYPTNFFLTVNMSFPKEMLVGDDYKVEDNDAFFFEEKITQTSAKTVSINYQFNLKKETLTAKEYKEVCEKHNEIAKDLPIVIYFPKN